MTDLDQREPIWTGVHVSLVQADDGPQVQIDHSHILYDANRAFMYGREFAVALGADLYGL